MLRREELERKILDVIERDSLAALATIDGDKSRVRYMVMRLDGAMDFAGATFLGSRKVVQIRKKNKVEMVMGGDPKNYAASYITVDGTADVITDLEVKEKYWCDDLANYFSGPEDPNFAIIKVTTEKIEYMEAGAQQPEIYVP